MKTPLFISQRTKTGVILVIFAALLAQDAQCESRFKRALGAIKERIGHSLNKSGDEEDDDDSRKNQRIITEQSLVKAQSRTLEYTTNSRTAPRQLSSNSNALVNPASARVSQSSVIYSQPKQSGVSPAVPSTNEKQRADSNVEYQIPSRSSSTQLSSTSYNSRDASAIFVPSVAGQPSLNLSRTKQSSINSVNPAVNEDKQRVNASTPPPLRDLPLDNIAPSPSISMTQPSATETPIKYATPVAGHPGFVYPPGMAAEVKNMLDVRGFAAGEKMRDPRTGDVFLVPEEHFVFSQLTKQ